MTVQQGTSAEAGANGTVASPDATQAMLTALGGPATPAAGAAPVTPVASVTPAAVTPAVGASAVDGQEPAWLPQRLGQAKSSAVKEMLSEFGYKSKEELDAALKAGKIAQDAALTEAERQANRIKELEPLTEQVKQYRALAEGFINTAFNALPIQVQQAIDSVALGDPFKRKAQLDVLQAAGYLSAASTANLAAAGNVPGAAPVVPVAPVVPLASAGATPPPPAAKPSGTRTMFEQWEAMEDPAAARIFYQFNGRQIEATRPS